MGCVESSKLYGSDDWSRVLTEEIKADFLLKKQEINALIVGTKYSDKERFIQQLLRFSQGELEPEDETNFVDCLQVNAFSNNITEICLTIFERQFRIIHLADGVEAFKSKWVHYLDHVNVILLVADLSQYSIHSSESSPEENYLMDSITLYEKVANHVCFREIPLFLFLLNPDVFEKKLSQVSLSSYFPEFKGTDSFKEASTFLLNEFESRVRKDTRYMQSKILHNNDSDDLRSLIQTIIDICPIENVQEERANQPQQSGICDEPLFIICIYPIWYCLLYCCEPTRSRMRR